MNEPVITSKVVTEHVIVVHLRDGHARNVFKRRTACGRELFSEVVDETIEQVTCKKCLKIAGSR